MESYERDEDAQRTPQDKAKLIVQALIATWLITGLALHLAAVGLIGLTVIVLATAFTGVTEEHALGKAFRRLCHSPPCSPSFSAWWRSSSINSCSSR
jgi:NhaB family Na+:H+ antiporter